MFIHNWFKNKFYMYLSIVVFILLLVGFVVVGKMDFTKEKENDSAKFVNEHSNVPVNNVFDYVNANDVMSLIKNDNALVLFGTKDNAWVDKYAQIVNEVATMVKVKKVYYYDITSDRNDKNGTYQAICEYLKDYLTHIETSDINIYAPALFIKISGVAALYDDETAFIKGSVTPEEYYNEYELNLKKATLTKALTDYKESIDGKMGKN